MPCSARDTLAFLPLPALAGSGHTKNTIKDIDKYSIVGIRFKQTGINVYPAMEYVEGIHNTGGAT